MVSDKGCLYLVATPIGNLEDMSYRAVKTLEDVDYILAEDTRHSIKLLNHFDIHKKLVSYHEHNQYVKADSILGDLKNGRKVALITDAGTPGISDPGSHLVLRCQEESIDYTIIPGPVAFVNALVISGQNTNRMVFEGFLPMKKKERQRRLEIISKDTRTIVFYEAPHKLKNTIKDLKSTLGGERSISFVRELTKRYEEVIKMTLEEAEAYYKDMEIKGEFVLLIEGMSEEQVELERQEALAEISMDDQMDEFIKQGLTKKDAIKAIAKERGLPKREVYQYFIDA